MCTLLLKKNTKKTSGEHTREYTSRRKGQISRRVKTTDREELLQTTFSRDQVLRFQLQGYRSCPNVLSLHCFGVLEETVGL